MRIASALILGTCLATSLFAQIRGSQPVGIAGGNAVYPAGGPGTPGVTRFPTSVIHPAGGQYYRGTGGSLLYTYPVYIGGYYTIPYSYVAPQDPAASAPVQPSVTVVNNQPQTPAAPVIINNYYGGPAPGPDMAQQPAQQPADEATPTIEPAHYLIAFLDHTIYAATAYWVDGDTLHYFTSGNVHNQVSLALVDRAFTQRLNQEAGVDVKLPAPAK